MHFPALDVLNTGLQSRQQLQMKKKLKMIIGLIAALSGSQAIASCYNPNQQATLNALPSLLNQLYPPTVTPETTTLVPTITPETTTFVFDPQLEQFISVTTPASTTFTPVTTPASTTSNYPSTVPTNSSTCDTDFLQSLTPDQILGMGTMATRLDGGKISQPWDYFRLKRKRKGGGSGDEDFSPLNLWSKLESSFGSNDNTFNQAGFNFNNHNFVFGADYRLRDNWVVGSSFAYRNNNATFTGGRGETLNDSYNGNLYTSYNITEALHVEATANYSGFSYETTRNINLAGIGSSVAKGSPDGGQYAFSWGGGYDFNYQALTVAPYARGEYMNLSIDSYSETGSDFAVRFGKQEIESMTSTVGIQSAYTLSFPWGVLIPQLRGEWHHQYLDGQRQIQANFVADPTGQNFFLTNSGPSRDYYTFGAEVSSVLPGGVSAFLAYESLQGYTNINSNKLMLGGRLEF